ncbi:MULTISPECIES: hypothetical protein [Hyphomonas]|uniref:hypothetical protein n=1 Tax=Hyphomonas TaxID=85 RepID=UPI0012FB5C37|nr:MULTISPECIES: hypothetical protein [Hyphomonas]
MTENLSFSICKSWQFSSNLSVELSVPSAFSEQQLADEIRNPLSCEGPFLAGPSKPVGKLHG